MSALEVKQTETFRKWRTRLKDERARALIAARISRIAFGNFGDVRAVGSGISEARIHFGPGYRIYFQVRGKTVLLLLCGGNKSTQARDIEAAGRLAAEWSDNEGKDHLV